MINKSKGINKYIKLIIAVTMLILSFSMSPNKAYADSGGHGGGGVSGGGAATWWHARGVKQKPVAWNYFVANAQKGSSAAVTKRVDSLSNQHVASGEKLSDVCKRSEFIWWYGGDNTGYWYENSGIISNLDINKNGYNMDRPDGSPGPARDWWNNVFMKDPVSRSNWYSTNVNKTPSLICSAGISEHKTITVTANSGTFKYDGRPKTVNGYKVSGDTLSSGDKVDAVAKNTKTAPGVYSVDVSSAKVVGSSSTTYTINTRKGTLIIYQDRPQNDSGELTQCIDSRSDSATAYTVNTTEGNSVFSPGGRLDAGSQFEPQNTPAGNHAGVSWNSNYGYTLPNPGDRKTRWDSWKSSFQSGSRTNISPDVSLNSDVLSKHGGVYEVNKRLTKDTFNMTHCMRQYRKYYWEDETYIEKDGTEKTVSVRKLTDWKDSHREVESVNKVSNRSTEDSGYQILGVNCNQEGFNRIASSVGGSVESNGKGSGLLITPTRSGRFTGRLGRSGETSTGKFYTDGTSCQEVFNCTSSRLAGAQNDADNNISEEPLFTEESKTSQNKPNEENQLEFFRDNNDRTVRADVWYPRETGASDLHSYPGQKASVTIANVYGGSPSIDLTTLESITGESIVDKRRYPGTKKQTLSGHHNKFNIKSQWASDEGKPYEIGVNWRYNSTWENTVPKTVSGERVVKSRDSNSGIIHTHCEFRNNKKVYRASIPKYAPHAYGTNSPELWDRSNSLRVLFNRSRSDSNR